MNIEAMRPIKTLSFKWLIPYIVTNLPYVILVLIIWYSLNFYSVSNHWFSSSRKEVIYARFKSLQNLHEASKEFIKDGTLVVEVGILVMVCVTFLHQWEPCFSHRWFQSLNFNGSLYMNMLLLNLQSCIILASWTSSVRYFTSFNLMKYRSYVTSSYIPSFNLIARPNLIHCFFHQENLQKIC